METQKTLVPTDRELIELAAKAAGLAVQWGYFGSGQEWLIEDSVLGGLRPWRPLTDDGDALRLAVKLRLAISHGRALDPSQTWEGVAAWCGPLHEPRAYGSENHRGDVDDAMAATRLAIVRAAAAVGRMRS